MIYTYEFDFYVLDPDVEKETEWDATQFCAETEEEAEDLFRDFCEENGFDWDNVYYSVEPVYDEDDAEEYGNEYGGYLYA